MIRCWYLLLMVFPLSLQAQFTYFLDQTIPVYDGDNNELSMPWAGGLNAAQYNTMDLDQDGTDDLVLYDRMANKVITFRPGTIQVVSVLGQQLSRPTPVQANEIYQYLLPRLASGLYLLIFVSNGKPHTQRFIIK